MPTPTDSPVRAQRRRPRHAHGLSVRVPLPRHRPATSPPEAADPRPRTLGRRILAASAAASVAALALATALPMAGPVLAEPAPADAPSQSLEASGIPGAEDSASMPEISAEASGASEFTAAFPFKPDAVVNYPFHESVKLTDTFGYRTAPVEQFHDGQDFAAQPGTPVKAIADGVVMEAGMADDGCGFSVKLQHRIDGKDVTSRYCHMQNGSNELQKGDAVLMGDPIGGVGDTGMSFGAHLHLAIRVADAPVDPIIFLAKYNRAKRP